jgi:hypothetical protein
VSEVLQKLGSSSLGDAGSAVDDQVFIQAHCVARAGFDGQRDTTVVADIAHLAVLGQVASHDLIAVETDPDDAHLRAAVRVQGHQVRQGRGFQHSPGTIGQRGHAVTLAVSAPDELQTPSVTGRTGEVSQRNSQLSHAA